MTLYYGCDRMKIMKLRVINSRHIGKGDRIILRPDFDLTVIKGRIQDDFRLKEVLPVIKFILKAGGRLRVISHLGRPGGKFTSSLSLKPIAMHLERMLRRRIIFLRNPFSEAIFRRYKDSKEIIFFDNIRFFPGEEENDRIFASRLARWGGVYINEAFANSHREHASIVGIPRFLPSYAGFRLEKEVRSLEKVLRRSHHPLVSILGGAKLETKLPLVKKFLSMGADIIVGGALANNFFLAKGFGVGKSRVDSDLIEHVKPFLKNPRLYLPLDLLVSRKVGERSRVIDPGNMRKDEIAFDVGPRTVDQISRVLHGARTIVWNGPLGMAEIRQFSLSTIKTARIISRLRAFSVLGGGDTVSILRKYGVLRGFSHISTGGGAMLEFLAKGDLPGLKVLRNEISRRRAV